MDRRVKHLIAAALAAFFCLPVLAGYAEAVPPSGWGATAADAPSGTYGRTAANSPWVNGSATGNVKVNVGGRATSIPARMRMAANAGRYAASRAFGNPYLILGAVGASLLLDWFQQHGFEWSAENQRWETQEQDPAKCYTAPCYEYKVTIYGTTYQRPTREELVPLIEAKFEANNTGFNWQFLSIDPNANGGFGIIYGQFCSGGCSTWYPSQYTLGRVTVSPAPATNIPVTQQEFEDGMDGPVPDDVGNALPIPLPIEQPAINPSPAPEYLPSPWRVPVGEPQPVPDTNPQKYKQPVVDVVPAGRPGSPWIIDLQPKEVVSEDPAGQQEPKPAADAPQGTVSTKEQQDICAANPGALMCQELDEPEDVDLPEREISLSITPDGGWGSDNAACPAPKSVNVLGQVIPIEYDLFCQFFSGMRPVVIAVAWLIAAGLVVGAIRRG